jgi:hypothetical protein
MCRFDADAQPLPVESLNGAIIGTCNDANFLVARQWRWRSIYGLT